MSYEEAYDLCVQNYDETDVDCVRYALYLAVRDMRLKNFHMYDAYLDCFGYDSAEFDEEMRCFNRVRSRFAQPSV